MDGKADVNVIVPVTPVASIAFGPVTAFDWVMQYRKSPLLPLPAPLSPVFVTVNVAGAMRSSNARSHRRAFGDTGRRVRRIGVVNRRSKRDIRRVPRDDRRHSPYADFTSPVSPRQQKLPPSIASIKVKTH
jgi:hypothetical protein